MVRLDNEIKVWFRFDNSDEMGEFIDYANKIILDMPVAERKQFSWDCDDGDDDMARMYILAENMPKVKKWVEDFNAQYKDDISHLPFYVDDAGQYIVNSKLMAKAIDRMTDEQFCGQLWWQAAGCGQYIVPFDYNVLARLNEDAVKYWWENGYKEESTGRITDEKMHFFISDVMIDDGSKDSSLEHHKSIPATLIAIHQAIADGRLHEDDTYITTRFNEDDKIFGAKSPKELARIAYPELYHELFEQDGVCHIWGDVVDGIDFDALLKDDIVLTDEQKATGDELFLDVPKVRECSYNVEFVNKDGDENSDYYPMFFDTKEQAVEAAKKTLNETEFMKAIITYTEEGWGHWNIVEAVEREENTPKLTICPWRKAEIEGDEDTLKTLYESIKDVIKQGYIEEYYGDGYLEVCYYPEEEQALMQALENINNG